MLIQVLYCIISYDNYLQFRALGGFSVKLLTFQERFLKPAHDKMHRGLSVQGGRNAICSSQLASHCLSR